MKHLILGSAPAIGETWEAMLQRFAEKVQQANDASVLIAALTTPHISAPLGQDPIHRGIHRHRRLSNNGKVNNIVQPESVDLPTINFNRSNPGNHLDASGYTDIGPLSCRDCGGEYYSTAGEQAFYKSKNFDDQPKKCKQCRQLAKDSSPDTSGKGWNTVAPTQSGWGSSGTDGAAAPSATSPSAKDLWASSGRTWPPKPSELPKGTAKKQ